MRTRPTMSATVALAAGMLALSAAGTAVADTNWNVHSPSMLCGTGTLSVQNSTSPCVARQGTEQDILKTRTEDVDLINRLEVALPAAVGG